MSDSGEIRDTLKRAAAMLQCTLHDLQDAATEAVVKRDHRAIERLTREITSVTQALATVQIGQNGYLTLGLLWDLKEQVEKNSAQMQAHFDRARH